MKKPNPQLLTNTRHYTHSHNTMSNFKAELECDKHALSVSEFIKDRLYFVTFRNKTHRNTTDVHFFNTDDELVYSPYYEDFGPLSLAAIDKYLNKMNFKLRAPNLTSKIIVHYTSANEKKRVNAAFLMAVYAIVHLKMTPNEAFNKLSFLKYPYLSFQDASPGESQYKIRLIDCLNAVRKAIYFGMVNFDDFNGGEYEKMESMKFGDVSWIVPQKFLAFSGPVDNPTEDFYHSPEFYLDYFRENNVKVVIRLNARMYNSKAFSNAGISHYDLYFQDGSVPPHEILTKFFEICENNSGAVAVHCKAGLGRTGCVIGAYLIKHYRMTGLEAIAWLRICRPGCIIGYQQTWLEEIEPSLWNMGDAYRVRYHGGAERIPHHKYGIYSFRLAGKPRDGSGQREEQLSTKDRCSYSFAEKQSFQSNEGCQTDESITESQGEKLNSAKRWRDVTSVMRHKKLAAPDKASKNIQ